MHKRETETSIKMQILELHTRVVSQCTTVVHNTEQF